MASFVVGKQYYLKDLKMVCKYCREGNHRLLGKCYYFEDQTGREWSVVEAALDVVEEWIM
ncbi:MAG: hypothetical protein MJK14_19620 [Rivularia sp. ALOHA_DT_140]|nr:hypothetical protein [Rivularia sp. ALOHA_DT_140]